MNVTTQSVIPANAGISMYFNRRQEMPAYAGMTMFFTVNVFFIGE
jgi:hypothetical protein